MLDLQGKYIFVHSNGQDRIYGLFTKGWNSRNIEPYLGKSDHVTQSITKYSFDCRTSNLWKRYSMVEMEKMSDMACICEYFILKLNKEYSYTSVLNIIMTGMKVEADIIASITMRSVCISDNICWDIQNWRYCYCFYQ